MNILLKNIRITIAALFLVAAMVGTGHAQKTGAGEQAFYDLTKAAPAAFKAGDIPRAKLLSQKLLKESGSWKENWNYGNAVHVANLVLGRIALLNNETDKAGNYLLAAGRTPGSPQLDSFGPNMSLALEMLDKGETEAVMKYFDLCGKFWKEFSKLDEWKAAVKNGTVPDFGPNLRYHF